MSIISIEPEIMWHKDLFLRRKSRELTAQEVKSSDFKKLVSYMLKSLYGNAIGVGLAAPQVGLLIQLVVIDIKRNGKKPIVLINPTYSVLGTEMVNSNETCLSFSGQSGVVPRHKRIKVKAKDVNFNDIEFETDTFLAVVCQHEIDHLNGNVYIDKAGSIGQATPYSDFLSQQALREVYSE